jgi:hypothetical protein
MKAGFGQVSMTPDSPDWAPEAIGPTGTVQLPKEDPLHGWKDGTGEWGSWKGGAGRDGKDVGASGGSQAFLGAATTPSPRKEERTGNTDIIDKFQEGAGCGLLAPQSNFLGKASAIRMA